MKKFFSAFLTAILLVFPISLSACSNDGEWKEIQSITYQFGSSHYQYTYTETTFVSTYTWDIEYEDISREEYDAAPQEYKEGAIDVYGGMQIDRKKQLSKLSEYKQIVYYFNYSRDEYGLVNPDVCSKRTYKNYEINYLKIRFMGDGSFELKNGDTTIRVLPTSYQITYFSS